MFIWLKRTCLLGLVTTLLASNVLLLTSTAFNGFVSSALLTTLGVRTVSDSLTQKLARSQARQAAKTTAVKRFGSGLVARTKRVAARGVAAIPAESIPYVGAAVIIASVSYELYEACQTLEEIEVLYAQLEVEAQVDSEAMQAVCSPREWMSTHLP